jgi:hypothetical protein
MFGDERKILKRIVVFIIAVVLIPLFTAGGYRLHITGLVLGMQETQSGCAGCHDEFSEILPQNHALIDTEELKICLTCHTAGGDATPFEWLVHFKHYATLEFTSDCWSCHRLDDRGNFSLTGVAEWKDIKATRYDAERMGPYFRSWGSSEYLDNRHGKQKVTCVLCHGKFFPKERATMEQCFECHGSYEQLVEKAPKHNTAMYPHFREEQLECHECHKAHEESVQVCKECH